MYYPDLSKGEHIFHHTGEVSSGGLFSAYTDEIFLTDRSIILVKKGLFGKPKEEIRYPLTSIVGADSVPKAVLGGENSGTYTLRISFRGGEDLRLGFQSNDKIDILMWINGISYILTGGPSPYGRHMPESTAGSVLRDIANVLQITVGGASSPRTAEYPTPPGLRGFQRGASPSSSPTGVFTPTGVVPQLSSTPVKKEEAKPRIISGNCPGCWAPVSGLEGSTVKCEYCMTYVLLE